MLQPKLGILVLATLLISNLPGAQVKSRQSYFMYVGTYGTGIYASVYEPGSKEIKTSELVGELPNASFIIDDPSHRSLYAVGEDEHGSVASFGIDATTGKLRLQNKVAVKGAGPCHLSLDQAAKMLFVANYSSGSVTVLPVESDASLGEPSQVLQLAGKGPVTDRQEGPHAHEAVISPDHHFVFVPDLGADKVRAFSIDAANHQLKSRPDLDVSVTPGMGPRHLTFGSGSKFVYVVGELNSGVTAFKYHAGKFMPIQSLSTLPKGVTGITKTSDGKTVENNPAEIAYVDSTKTVYVSNRGHNSISVFHADTRNGKLTMIQNVPTQGDEPRHFATDPTGHMLFVANQNSNNIVLFNIAEDGKLAPTGQTINVTKPVCVLFVPAG